MTKSVILFQTEKFYVIQAGTNKSLYFSEFRLSEEDYSESKIMLASRIQKAIESKLFRLELVSWKDYTVVYLKD